MNVENVNEKLHASIRMNDYALMKDLINKGADLNYKNKEKKDALYYAVIYSTADILRYLVSKGANASSIYNENKNLLHFAIENESERKGNLEIVQFLISAGINVNDQDKYGNTPLWYACIYFKINLLSIQLLLEAGARTDIKNKYGATIISSAEENNQVQLVSILEKR